MATKNNAKNISEMIKKNPAIQTLYNTVKKYLESLGPIVAIPHKTQISFGGANFKTNFAFIWLPQTLNKKLPQDCIMLTIDLPRHQLHRKIHDTVHLRSIRWAHHILLTHVKDFDSDVKTWLRESFEFGKVGLRTKTLKK